jgi:hypothetical protein
LILVKVIAGRDGEMGGWPRRLGCGRKEVAMQVTIFRLYDSYADANRVIVMLESVGVPMSDTSIISNNSDGWYSAPDSPTVVPAHKQEKKDGPKQTRRQAGSSRAEGAALGAAIGATAATAASLVTMLALPGIGTVVGAGWLAALLGSMAIGGATGGLLGALTSLGVNDEDAQVFVEGVRRGGTLVTARAPDKIVPRVESLMDQGAVNLKERSDLYRKCGWQAFDAGALPYTADQVRCERALHAASVHFRQFPSTAGQNSSRSSP